ncbi:MAG: hypothetical protein ACRC3Y_04110, partial [Romboutsia sp.]|uniref:hypothetical protein n=1 Tax=Romboutsia sp. TaxID=1965302 RepID=UPI003F3C96AD
AVSGYVAAEAGSKSVSITAGQTSVSSSSSKISSDTPYRTSLTNNKNPFNRSMYIEVKRIVEWGLDDTISSQKVSSGSTGNFTGMKIKHNGSHYVTLDPEGVAAAGCVGKGSFTW